MLLFLALSSRQLPANRLHAFVWIWRPDNPLDLGPATICLRFADCAPRCPGLRNARNPVRYDPDNVSDRCRLARRRWLTRRRDDVVALSEMPRSPPVVVVALSPV